MSDDIDDLLGPSPEEPQDELYEEAVQVVLTNRRASTSFVQRKLAIGYNRAASLVERMEREGIVQEPDVRGARKILAEAPETTPGKGDFPTQQKSSYTDGAIVQALLRPVSISFLADVLKRDRKTVTSKLANLEPMGYHRGHMPLYDFRQALAYLVTAKVNAAEIIKRMGTNDLPLSLQKDAWDARLKQQKWMLDAGELWPTEDVLEVLGEAFQRLKSTTQLWIDQLSEEHALPPEVRKDLTAMVDGLQKDLHLTLVEMPLEKKTRSQQATIEGTELDD